MSYLEQLRESLEVVASGGSRLDLSDIKALRVIVHSAIAYADLLENGRQIRWCEIHGDWAPMWVDEKGQEPPRACRWAHHVLHDKPENPCRIVSKLLTEVPE